MSAKKPHQPLEELLREARVDLTSKDHGPRSDWSNVDAGLFERIESARASANADPRVAQHALRGLGESGPRSRRAWIAVGLVAAAASVAVVLHRPQASSLDGNDENELAEHARADKHARPGSLASREGTGEVRIGGAPAEAGRALAVGDTIDTARDARALFLSGSDPKRSVSWSLEATSRVEVRRAESPLVLGLAQGAVEAQVTPVPNGEAFAIDVDGLRIAVHGTHLRVAREGTHVTIDLTEGVVSIGAPPRSGSTYGTLVIAPAHVEIDLGARDLPLQVEHAASRVRPAARLASLPASGNNGERHPELVDLPPTPPSTSSHTPSIEGSMDREGATQGIVSSPAPHQVAPQHGADANPELTIATAVKACAVKHLRAADVRVTVSSRLSLRVGDDGLVTFARFDPPLAPAAQECAATSIYKTRFAHAGTFEIPIEVAPQP